MNEYTVTMDGHITHTWPINDGTAAEMRQRALRTAKRLVDMDPKARVKVIKITASVIYDNEWVVSECMP